MSKHCATCTCPQPQVETTVRNGVKVKKTTFPSGTVVTADCQCFGYDFRVHSRVNCPNRLRLIDA